MFNFFFVALVLIGIVTWICIRLRNWKQRVAFLLVVIVGIPAVLFYGFNWGWKNREQKLLMARVECRRNTIVDGLQLIFNGYNESDSVHNCFTIHKNSKGLVLDRNKQQLKTSQRYKGGLSVEFIYDKPFRTDDILEIKLGQKVYSVTNFVLTAAANYNMGGPVLDGCRIDSADINGRRTAFYQNMIIYKTDHY